MAFAKLGRAFVEMEANNYYKLHLQIYDYFSDLEWIWAASCRLLWGVGIDYDILLKFMNYVEHIHIFLMIILLWGIGECFQKWEEAAFCGKSCGLFLNTHNFSFAHILQL